MRDTAPEDVMNALPILTELQEHAAAWQSGGKAHVINLTLLPLSDGDSQFLDAALGGDTASWRPSCRNRV